MTEELIVKPLLRLVHLPLLHRLIALHQLLPVEHVHRRLHFCTDELQRILLCLDLHRYYVSTFIKSYVGANFEGVKLFAVSLKIVNLKILLISIMSMFNTTNKYFYIFFLQTIFNNQHWVSCIRLHRCRTSDKLQIRSSAKLPWM